MVAFSYYGSKSKFVQHYPPPRHHLIIEPFCGAANYALRYWRNEVALYDLDQLVISAWRFLQREDALDWIRRLPVSPRVHDRMEDVLPTGAPPEMQFWLERVISRGDSSKKRNCVTQYAACDWGSTVSSVQIIVNQIRHWKIECLSYRQVANVEATWFIDPPYSGRAGSAYRHSSSEIDYAELADWCLSRKGQVIVCEMEGADWLPFGHFREVPRAAFRGGRENKRLYKEVMFYREK